MARRRRAALPRLARKLWRTRARTVGRARIKTEKSRALLYIDSLTSKSFHTCAVWPGLRTVARPYYLGDMEMWEDGGMLFYWGYGDEGDEGMNAAMRGFGRDNLPPRVYSPIMVSIMARRLTFRLLALLLLATFGFAQVGRAHTHQCPTHDGGVTPTSTHHSGAHSAPATSDSEQEHQQCNCLGECCTSAVAINVGTNAQLTAATSFNFAPHVRSSDVALPLNPEHQLPLSTGPPSQVSLA